MTHRLLLVEDEDVIRRALTRLLERRGFEVVGAASVEAAAREVPNAFDVLLVDVRLPDADGTDLIPAADPVPVVVMTSHASVRSAVEAMRRGAIDYIAKPFDHDELLLVLERAVQHRRLDAQNRALRRELERDRSLHRLLEGTSLARLADDAVAALATGEPTRRAPRLFVHGEIGSGREALARGLHERLRGGGAPFVVADPPDPGTGALDASAAVAAVREARHGTLALRHPELLDAAARARIVAGCEAADAMLVGIGPTSPAADATAPAALDPAFVDAFDLVLEALPLQRRRDDAVTLARHAVARVASRRARPELALDRDAEAWVRARDWPGNTIELDQVIGRAASTAPGNLVAVAALEAAAIAPLVRAATSGDPPGTAGTGHSLSLDEYFRWFVLTHQDALSETALAARLGISRKALWERRQREALPRGSAPRTAPRGHDPSDGADPSDG